MYAQQQVNQQSAPAVQQAPDLAPTCEQDALGNQALVQEAGLDGGNSSLADDMFDFVLDCLPLAVALPMARARIGEESVQAWAMRQDPADVVDAMALSLPQLLAAQWPVGVGVCLSGALKGALGIKADLEGDVELVRTGADTVRLKVLSETAVTLGTVGAKLALEGANGEAIAALGATDKAALELDLEGHVEGGAKQLVVGALAAAAAPESIGLLLSAARAVDITQAVSGIDLEDHLPIPDIAWESRSRVTRTARAIATSQIFDSLPVDLGQLLPCIQPILDSLGGALQVSASGEFEVIQGDAGMGFRQTCTLEGLMQLAATPLLAAHIDIAALQLLAQQLEADASVQLEAGFTLGDDGGITLDGDWIRLSVMTTRSVGDSSQTDCLDFFASDLLDVAQGLANGEGVSALVAATGFRRTVQLPAPEDLVASVVPSLGIAAADLLSDHGPLTGNNDLLLEGSLVAAQGVMDVIAASSIEAPQGMGPAEALGDIHTALCGLATQAGQLPGWLAPWSDVLEEAASAMQLEAPRLKGRIEVAAGYELSAAAIGAVGGGERASAGIAVDKVLDDLDGLSVRETLAGGLFGSGAAGGECQQDIDHADTGTETGSTRAAGPDDLAL